MELSFFASSINIATVLLWGDFAPLTILQEGIETGAVDSNNGAPWLSASRVMILAGASFAFIVAVFIIRQILTSDRLDGASLFNRLFIVVAVTSAFFSAVSSAIGFGLITSQENVDVFRNTILPPAFGIFVFFVTLAIWVGGAELVRNRDWFRGLAGKTGLAGFGADILFFIERSVKLFIVMPILAIILFLVSTWTSVVGIAGVDGVRYTYSNEIVRIQSECNGVVAFRQNDLLFLDDLKLAIGDARRAALTERNTGGQTGLRGPGPATDYFDGVAEWLSALEQSAATIVERERDVRPYSVYDKNLCAVIGNDLQAALGRNAFDNFDLWNREFTEKYDNFSLALNRWRLDRRLLSLIEQQINSFDRANPRPYIRTNSAARNRQSRAIDQYATAVQEALKSLARRMKLRKPPAPILSAAELSPERGLEIFTTFFNGNPNKVNVEPVRKSRTQAIVEKENIPGLSVITPRDAVLKNFQIFSDVWALALSWDYASYVLLLAYLLFPSAERAAGRKDDLPI